MTWVAIALMSIATYMTRASGFWLSTRLAKTDAIDRFLRHTPAAILVSMIAPHAISHGHEELLGFITVAIVQRIKNNLLVSLACGLSIVVLMRHFHL